MRSTLDVRIARFLNRKAEVFPEVFGQHFDVDRLDSRH